MANWKKGKIDLSTINNGQRYNNNEPCVDAEAINGAVEASAYAQDLVEGYEARIINVEDAIKGNVITEQTDEKTAYFRTVPQNALPYAVLNSVGGATRTTNENIIDTISINIGSEYGSDEYVFGNFSGYVVQAPFVVDVTEFPTGAVSNELRLLWGEADDTDSSIMSKVSSNTVHIFKSAEKYTCTEQHPKYFMYYELDGLYHVNVVIKIEGKKVPSKCTGITGAEKFVIPEYIQNLKGYGMTGSVLDFNAKTFTNPEGNVTNVSFYLPSGKVYLKTKAGGVVTTENKDAQALPLSITYQIKKSGV